MKILMVDDHALFRDGLRLLLSSIRPDTILFEADTVADALSVLQEHPDLTLCLLDLNLRQERGLPVLKKIRFESPGNCRSPNTRSRIISRISSGSSG